MKKTVKTCFYYLAECKNKHTEWPVVDSSMNDSSDVLNFVNVEGANVL